MILLFILIVVMVMAVALVVLILVVVRMVAAAVILVLVFLRQALHLQLSQLRGKGCLAFHSFHQLFPRQRVPGGGDHRGHLVMLPEQGNGSVQLGLGNGIGAGQDDGGSGLDLVVVELAEVLHIHLDLARVSDSHGIAQGNVLAGDLVDGTDDVRQLAHTGGLNENTVRMVLLDHLGQGLAKVAHQRAADASGIHLGDLDAGILQEAAVDTDFAELIFNEYQLLALVGLGDHFLDEGRLAGAQKTGININFCHK